MLEAEAAGLFAPGQSDLESLVLTMVGNLELEGGSLGKQ